MASKPAPDYYDDRDVAAAIRRACPARNWRVLQQVHLDPAHIGIRDLKTDRKIDYLALAYAPDALARGFEHKRTLTDFRKGMASGQWDVWRRVCSEYGILWTGAADSLPIIAGELPHESLWVWHFDAGGKMRVYKKGKHLEPPDARLLTYLLVRGGA